MASKPSPEDFVFRERTGEVLVKQAGSINGNGFVLDRLVKCEVYILDHTSQVQVDDCVDCKIMIGPCDGSVFIRDSSNCTASVASRQLRTRDCTNLTLSLYCATQPSIETSKDITFKCWNGAYPGLTAQFQAAKLDPTKNTWEQVYDFNSADGPDLPHFTISQEFDNWWVAPVAGSAECPVAAPDGSLFGGGHAAEPPLKSPGADSTAGAGFAGSLPPSPGRPRGWDEEVELEDEPAVELPPGVEDGGRSFRVAAPTPKSPAAAFLGENPFVEDAPPPPAPVAAPAAAAPAAAPAPAPGAALAAPAPAPVAAPAAPVPVAAGIAFDEDAFAPPPVPQAAAPPPAYGSGGEEASYQGMNGTALDGAAAAPVADAAGDLSYDDAFFSPPQHPAHPAAEAAAAQPVGAAAAEADEDSRIAWRAANAQRLAKIDAEESKAKTQLQQDASKKIEALQKSRTVQMKQRYATNRAQQATSAAGGSAAGSSATGWARVVELLDLTRGSSAATKAAGGGAAVAKDVTRFKQLMTMLKDKKK